MIIIIKKNEGGHVPFVSFDMSWRSKHFFLHVGFIKHCNWQGAQHLEI